MPKKTKNEKSTKQETKETTSSRLNYLKDPSEFDIKRLAFKYVNTDNKDATQINCFPKYKYEGDVGNGVLRDGDNFIFTSDPITLTKGGIPSLDEKWRKSDADRMFFWLGYDKSQPECVALFNVLREVDTYMLKEINENKNSKKILAKLSSGKETALKNLQYTPAVKLSPTRDDDDDDDDGKKDDNKNAKKYEPYERVKVRFSTKFDESLGPNDPKEINTVVFVKDKEKPERVSTPTDIAKLLYWNCTAKFVLAFSKIWIQTSNEKKCGLQ
jgi:hypothetical protein